MDVEQVDIVALQQPQAFLDRGDHALAMVAAGVRIAWPRRHGVFGRDHESLALALSKFSDKPLRGAVGVVVGRIDEVAAAIDVSIEDAPRFVLLCAPAPVRPERHRAKGERRNPKAGTAEQTIRHKIERSRHGNVPWLSFIGPKCP
jgi:hypothetical protein